MESGRTCGLGLANQLGEHRFVFLRQSRCDDVVIGGERNLILRDKRQLLRDARIHLVADRENAEGARVGIRAGGDRTKKNPVQAAVVVPPRSGVALAHRTLDVALGGFRRESGIGHVQGHDLAVGLSKHEEIAAGELPIGR